MKTITKISLLLFFSILTVACNKGDSQQKIAVNTPQTSYTLEGITINAPETIENLSLFMLTGKEKITGKSYSTLSEAMNNKQVTVKETGTVNQLSINNKSNAYVFIHSGDIVKGGKQDRTIAYDVIIAPNTKDIPLESFCVEEGRWRQRANETVSAFSSNSKMISSKDLKLAAKHERNQRKVWSKVSEQKGFLNEKLSRKNGYAVDVTDNESDTSLQLALESEELEKVREDYFETLKGLIDTPDAIGYAYTINGEIYGVEVYNNEHLFKDLWEKILESVVVEAISKEGEDLKPHKTQADILTYMELVKSNDKKTVKKLNEVTNFETLENKNGHLVFTTEDLVKQDWVHKSFMKMDPAELNKRRDAIELINQE
ncbi:DUF6569 family protein [Seonamhaeicola sp.]|uniref:ARPP-1 family domain-containing protein n=1 Tax=Seonamhaeicola sp. TaxID=1912245 RepID=UPI002621B691|nr:DUF6569 family protein [Seonamhaeicola sp.]